LAVTILLCIAPRVGICSCFRFFDFEFPMYYILAMLLTTVNLELVQYIGR